MPYTTQRNGPLGGRVEVAKKHITVSFKKDGQKATLPISAKKILSLTTLKAVGIQQKDVTIVTDRNMNCLPITKGDLAVNFWLHRNLDGSDLMIVSRRGLRRAARKTLQTKRRSK